MGQPRTGPEPYVLRAPLPVAPMTDATPEVLRPDLLFAIPVISGEKKPWGEGVSVQPVPEWTIGISKIKKDKNSRAIKHERPVLVFLGGA